MSASGNELVTLSQIKTALGSHSQLDIDDMYYLTNNGINVHAISVGGV